MKYIDIIVTTDPNDNSISDLRPDDSYPVDWITYNEAGPAEWWKTGLNAVYIKGSGIKDIFDMIKNPSLALINKEGDKYINYISRWLLKGYEARLLFNTELMVEGKI